MAASDDALVHVHAKALREMLTALEGVHVKAIDTHIVVDGTVLSREEMDRVVKVVGLYPEAVSLVVLHPQVPVDRAEKMAKAIHQDPDCAEVTVEFVNGTFFLRGTVSTEGKKQNALTIAETYLPELMTSESLKQGVLAEGVKKNAIRNFIQVRKR